MSAQADGRGPLSPLGKVAAQPSEEVTVFPFGESGAQPSREVTAFPFGEGGGAADGRGLEWRAAPREVRLPFYFYFYFNSATIATIIETIEVNAANSPNI